LVFGSFVLHAKRITTAIKKIVFFIFSVKL
jgi:hypothetical protein